MSRIPTPLMCVRNNSANCAYPLALALRQRRGRGRGRFRELQELCQSQPQCLFCWNDLALAKPVFVWLQGYPGFVSRLNPALLALVDRRRRPHLRFRLRRESGTTPLSNRMCFARTVSHGYITPCYCIHPSSICRWASV
jgi:hypothetical protein